MPPEAHAALVAELFKSAAEVEPRNRAAFLDRHCGANRELRAELESLLRTQDRAGRFLERSAADVAARNFAREGAFVAGQAVGEYEIVSLIGQGGMGEVYLARDRQLQRNVALKLMRRGMETEDIVRRFQHEQRLLAGLNHPNIAQLYDAGLTEDGIPFFAMEHIDGTRIDEYCDTQALTLRERLDLFSKVCGAVHHAHQHLVVHRDIKPSNILVTAEGEPKLLDFGIAKALDAATQTPLEQTLTLQNIMTPEYASPEHVRGDAITTASDVYSLGVLLYELLTGAKPYKIETHTPVEIARIINDIEPARPSNARTNSPPSEIRNPKSLRGDLDNIVLMAMRKEPQRRYPSAAQLGADIRRHLDGLPVSARKDTLRYRSSKFIRRNRLAAAAAALVLVSIIAGLLVALWQAEQARAQRDLARREKSKAERINQFLQTMLSFSNQSTTSVSPVAQKKDVTVNQMLEAIVPRVDHELADQPDVRAQVLRTIGSSYASQGQYEAAVKHLRSALEIQTRLFGENNAEAIATMFVLGAVRAGQLDFREARGLLQKAVAFYRQQRQEKDPAFREAKLAQALDALGTLEALAGDRQIGQRMLEEALQIAVDAQLQGPNRAVLASIQTNLGGLLVTIGSVDKGVALLQQALTEFAAISSQPRWEVGATKVMLGVAAGVKNNLDEAEKYLVESEQIYRSSLGDSNGYILFNLVCQATIYFRKGDLPRTELKVGEALAVAKAIPQSFAAQLWITLGDIQMRLAPPTAEETFREALQLAQDQPAKDYPSIVTLHVRLSQSLLAQGRLEEARKIALEVEPLAREKLGAQHPILKTIAECLAAASASPTPPPVP